MIGGAQLWILAALGLGVVVFRRRSVAVGLVTAQALVLAGNALAEGDAGAAAALALRGLLLGLFFVLLVARTRERKPVRAATSPFVRAGAAVALALILAWLVPSLGLDSRRVELAVLALVAFGLVTATLRRATLFQILGIVLLENGLALAALDLSGSASLAVEAGVALDLLLVGIVAGVFHERIFAEFGAGDSAALRGLRD